MLTEAEKDRCIARLHTCRKQIKKAKFDMSFWSEEMRIVVEQLTSDRQFNFDDVLKQEIDNG